MHTRLSLAGADLLDLLPGRARRLVRKASPPRTAARPFALASAWVDFRRSLRQGARRALSPCERTERPVLVSVADL